MKKHIITLMAAAATMTAAQAQITVDTFTAASFTVSNTDLLQTQFASYGGDSLSEGTNANDTLYLTQLAGQGVTTGEASLRDGTWYNNDAAGWGSTTGDFTQIGKASAESRGSALVQSNETAVFNFDVSTNTNGYDITGVDLYSNWGSGDGRNEINVTISLALIGTPTVFDQVVLIGEIYNPISTGDVDGTQGLLRVAGITTTNVAAIQFEWLTQENGAVGYSELDVFGTASAIPEPSTFALLAGLLAFGAIVTRRR